MAAFAFQMRVGGMVEMGRMGGAMTMPMAGQAGEMAPHHSAAQVRSPLQSPEAVSPLSPSSGRHHNQEGQNHGPHCPFCVTGAFALEAGVLPLSTAPPRQTSRAQFYATVHLAVAIRHADARAPPVLL